MVNTSDDIGPYLDIDGDDDNYQVWIENSMEKFSPESKYNVFDEEQPNFGKIFLKDERFGNSLFEEVISQIYSDPEEWFNDGPDVRASSVVGYVLTFYLYMANLGPRFTSIGTKLPPKFPESLRLIAYKLSLLLTADGYSTVNMRLKAIQQTRDLFSKPGKQEFPATERQRDIINSAVLFCIETNPKVFRYKKSFKDLH